MESKMYYLFYYFLNFIKYKKTHSLLFNPNYSISKSKVNFIFANCQSTSRISSLSSLIRQTLHLFLRHFSLSSFSDAAIDVGCCCSPSLLFADLLRDNTFFLSIHSNNSLWWTIRVLFFKVKMVIQLKKKKKKNTSFTYFVVVCPKE